MDRERDSISLRFRTQAKNGLIMFITTDTLSFDKYMFFEVKQSKLYVIIHFGTPKFFTFDPVISDGRWHVIDFTRVGRKVTLRLDQIEDQHTFRDPVQFPYRYTYLGKA